MKRLYAGIFQSSTTLLTHHAGRTIGGPEPTVANAMRWPSNRRKPVCWAVTV